MIYRQFFTEDFDKDGVLQSAKLQYPEDFNFAYHVMDPLAEKVPDKLAMLWRNDRGEEQRFTFSDMQCLSRKAAGMFRSWGLKKGDAVMVCLRCRYEYWYLALAAHRLGILLCPVFHLLSTEDFRYRLEKLRPVVVISLVEGDIHRNLKEAADQLGLDRLYSVGGKADGFTDLAQEMERAQAYMEREATQAEEPILLYFTSGSTGNPKGVLHNHSFLLGTLLGARYMQDNGPDGLHFATGNTGWQVICGTKFYGQWFCESSIFVYDYERFDPQTLLRQLEELRVTSVMAQPSVYRQLTEAGMDRYDLSAVTCLAVGGEKLRQDLSETVYAQTGQRLYEGYAQSEAGLIAANSKNAGWKQNSVGKILPKYHVELLKRDGSFAKPGEPGELVVVADDGIAPVGLLMGFYGEEEPTDVWDGNLFHSGDLLWRDEDDFLFYLGRNDGLIKSSGYRISPFEIENALSKHPAVHECLVVGQEDARWGEKICAYVRLSPGYHAHEDLPEELRSFHNKDCSRHQQIRALHIVPQLLRNANGKLIRNQFQET